MTNIKVDLTEEDIKAIGSRSIDTLVYDGTQQLGKRKYTEAIATYNLAIKAITQARAKSDEIISPDTIIALYTNYLSLYLTCYSETNEIEYFDAAYKLFMRLPSSVRQEVPQKIQNAIRTGNGLLEKKSSVTPDDLIEPCSTSVSVSPFLKYKVLNQSLYATSSNHTSNNTTNSIATTEDSVDSNSSNETINSISTATTEDSVHSSGSDDGKEEEEDSCSALSIMYDKLSLQDKVENSIVRSVSPSDVVLEFDLGKGGT